MKWWNAYTALVKRNCINSGDGKELLYWRNDLFAGILIYLLPFCFIALLPGIYLGFHSGQLIIAIVDIAAVSVMAAIAFIPGPGIGLRKILFISCAYLFSCAMLYYLGLPGPGLIYLLISCIFSILIFSTAYSFWAAWLNTIICFLVAVAMWFQLISRDGGPQYSMGEWVAVSANLIFLSFLASALIPRLFNGLQETIQKEKLLKEVLSNQQQSLQEALQMLEQKNKELEQFAYVASHDLKEPLRMVTSFLGLLKSKYNNQLDEKAHIYIEFAIDGGQRMQKMIDDLLELSRTGRQLIKEPVDMNKIVKEAEHNIMKLVEENRAEIMIKKSLPVLVVYKADIIRLFQNLLSNAIKFRKKETNPQIKIDATEHDTEWVFSMEDNGIGIRQDKFEKIFEVFVRLHSQETYEGTGIGLAVCKKVVEHHGGRIWIESSEGKGTVFYFTIKK